LTAHGPLAPPSARREAGVTLVEIVVALTILAAVVVFLGSLMYQVSLQTRRSAVLSFLSAAKQSAETRVEGTSWDSLASPSFLGCATDTTGQLVYYRCTTVTDTAKLRRIQVVLTPTGTLTVSPDTVLVYRVKPAPKSPFNP
jgi:Tfp pilus assembly protein PilE